MYHKKNLKNLSLTGNLNRRGLKQILIDKENDYENGRKRNGKADCEKEARNVSL